MTLTAKYKGTVYGVLTANESKIVIGTNNLQQ